MEINKQSLERSDYKYFKIIIITSLIGVSLTAAFFIICNLLSIFQQQSLRNTTSFTISGRSNSNTNKIVYNQLINGDKIKIVDNFIINDENHSLENLDLVIVVYDGGRINWNGKYNFYLGLNSKLFLIRGSHLNSNVSCNHQPGLFLGNNRVVSCDGKKAKYSFSQVIALGGINNTGLTNLSFKLSQFDVPKP